MDVRITPEPEEQDAVLAAVEELLSRDPLPAAYRSVWRQRAIRENVEVSGGGYIGRSSGTLRWFESPQVP